MSQLNFTSHRESENIHLHRNAKQFSTSDIPRSVKKTALADVKNILAQRTVHSTKKFPQTSVTKSNNPFKNFYNKENEIVNRAAKKQETEKLQMKEASTTVTRNDFALESVVPACSFCDKVEDDYADILFKKITLTKSEIDTLALEWERPPVVCEKDMRKISIPSAIPDVELSFIDVPSMFDFDNSELDFSLLNDIPAVESISDFEDENEEISVSEGHNEQDFDLVEKPLDFEE